MDRARAARHPARPRGAGRPRRRRARGSGSGLSGPAIAFRPLAEADLATLHGWLLRPHVAAWWGPAESVEELRADFLADDGPRATRAFVATADGRDVGFCQVYGAMGSGDGWWEDESDPGVRGIDQFLADEADLGRGLGRAVVRAFVARVFAEDAGATAVQTDPRPDNARAIRCYAAAGFADAGLVETPDGPARLMVVRRPA